MCEIIHGRTEPMLRQYEKTPFEKAVERSTGLSIEAIRKMPLHEIRRKMEQKRKDNE